MTCISVKWHVWVSECCSGLCDAFAADAAVSTTQLVHFLIRYPPWRRYDGDQRLMDPGDKAVMMAWEGCAARLSCTYTLQEVWAG